MKDSMASLLGNHLQSVFSRMRYQQTPTAEVQDDEQPEQLELSNRSPAVLQSSFSKLPESQVILSSDAGPATTLLREEGEAAENTGLVSNKKRHEWINGVYQCARVGACITALNLIFTIVAAVLASRNSDGSFGSAVIYWGDCALTKRWEFALHLVINVLSTCMLGTSNYCMQTLVAPTREEVDSFHARGQWLDIGGASFRNLRAIGRYRLTLWIILMLTATPFHLMYNSMIFYSFGQNYPDAFIAPKDLNSSNVHSFTTPALEKCFACPNIQDASTRDGPSWTAALNWTQIASEISSGNYERSYDMEKCSLTPNQGVRAIVMLSDDLTTNNNGNNNASLRSTSLNSFSPSYISTSATTVHGFPFFNESTGYGTSAECFNGPIDSAYDFDSDFEQRSIVKECNVTECLLIKSREHCQLLFSPSICLVILLASVIKVSAMFLAARIGHMRSQPLLTCGDAISSFMSNPDPTTKDLCWLSSQDIRQGYWGASKRTSYPRTLSKRRFWFQAATTWRWLMTLLICVVTITTAIYLLCIATPMDVDGYTGYGISFSSFKEALSFDEESAAIHTYLNDGSTLSYVVVANCPQVVITICYYWYNAVLTSMLAAAEYSSYGAESKGLRVTWPVKGSCQMSTYYLSIPYRYSIPVLLLYILLHWMVSQSFFFYWNISYSPQNKPDPFYEATKAIGYSMIFILFAIIIGAIMVFLLCALALRRFKSSIPLDASCSAVISAACHPLRDEARDTAALGKVKWGEIIIVPEGQMEIEPEVGHCSFTSLDTVTPTLSKKYS